MNAANPAEKKNSDLCRCERPFRAMPCQPPISNTVLLNEVVISCAWSASFSSDRDCGPVTSRAAKDAAEHTAHALRPVAALLHLAELVGADLVR